MLKVEDLEISFADKNNKKEIVKKISFDINEGEIVGVVGESGCGKSVTAMSVMRLLPDNAVVSGKIIFDGSDITEKSIKELQKIRGNEMCMIFQEPQSSLNPTMKIGKQVEEVLKLHTDMSKEERKEKVLKSFESVGLKEPVRIYKAYPHQLSGGMRQRVMIAMAVMMEPKLLIADEPTTAIDVTTQRQILALIKEVSVKKNMAVLFITHDLKLARQYCSRILVMKDGQIVEQGDAREIFDEPKHEYTRKLLSSVFIRSTRKEE